MFKEKEFSWYEYVVQLHLAENKPGIIMTFIGEVIIGESREMQQVAKFYQKVHIPEPPRGLWLAVNNTKRVMDNFIENHKANNEN